jgi:predicted HicB family RNase H-like nuclease
MKRKAIQKRYKTFPLEIDQDLHKALKYKAIESDQTLHAFILKTLIEKVREEPAQYAVSAHQFNRESGKEK